MEWLEEDGKLVKEFKFENFVWAVHFINKLVPVAEEMEHHPDLFIHSYNQVKIMLMTHSEGKITQKDYDMAEKIDEIYT